MCCRVGRRLAAIVHVKAAHLLCYLLHGRGNCTVAPSQSEVCQEKDVVVCALESAFRKLGSQCVSRNVVDSIVNLGNDLALAPRIESLTDRIECGCAPPCDRIVHHIHAGQFDCSVAFLVTMDMFMRWIFPPKHPLFDGTVPDEARSVIFTVDPLYPFLWCPRRYYAHWLPDSLSAVELRAGDSQKINAVFTARDRARDDVYT